MEVQVFVEKAITSINLEMLFLQQVKLKVK